MSPYRVLLVFTALTAACPTPGRATPSSAFLEAHCFNCHDDLEKKAGLDLTSLAFRAEDPRNLATWVLIHDRVRAGEMPPPDKKRPSPSALDAFLSTLSGNLDAAEASTLAEGRATRRRLNRLEYENSLRDLFAAPWLQLREGLPEDGESHRFSKVGEALDLSHISLARYLAVAESALRQVAALELEPPISQVVRHHARDQRSFARRMTYSSLDQRPDRHTFPVLDSRGQPDVLDRKVPITVGPADPGTRDREAMGVVGSTYEPLMVRFDQFRAPASGRYRIRVAAYSVWTGSAKPGGTYGEWEMPDRSEVSPGRRPEPIVFYAEVPGQLRRIGAFDAGVTSTIGEFEADLVQGETIRPDCVRFFRSRIGPARNPLATREGQPGVAFQWLEAEGPLVPPAGLPLFAGLPRAQNAAGRPEPVSTEPVRDATRLLRDFVVRAYRHPPPDGEAESYLPIVEAALREGATFFDAMLAGYTAVLASPAFLSVEARPGLLDDYALAARLAFFLRNSAPDAALRAAAGRGELRRPEVLRAHTDRLLAAPEARRFTDAFLDSWLDLKAMQATTPDSALYNDYWLDDALTEAAVDETQLFFAALLRDDMPTRTLVTADFTFANERLAAHYGLAPIDGVGMRRVALPPDSPRGGLLTQASVLKVTANGTTTSPILRGAWIMERIMGMPPLPPPPGTPAVEPDTRGATTIREQLDKHRSDASCAACHTKIDPAGFALESFDVMGGFREKYRAVVKGVAPVPGRGKSGYYHAFHYAQPVDASGKLWDGRPFAEIREFKRLLLTEERQLARNLVRQLSIYATGAPVRFSDRDAIEAILDRAAAKDYGVRTLVHELVQSELFRNK